MSTELVKTNEPRFTPQQIELLKQTVCKGVTNDEFKIFCYAVQRTGLDPFMKQIHAVKRWNAKAGREDMSIQVGIDGYRLIADRTGLYAGNDEAIFDNEQKPTKATVTVYKLVQGQRCAFTATARWSEYYPGDKQGFMWNKMPCVMLGKVAETLALRKAFPAELSGVYTDEEMQQADKGSEIKNEKVVATYSSTPDQNTNGEAARPVLAQIKSTGVPVVNLVEIQAIRALQSELQISDEDLKAELFAEFKLESLKAATLQQLQNFREILLAEKEARNSALKPSPEFEAEMLSMGGSSLAGELGNMK